MGLMKNWSRYQIQNCLKKITENEQNEINLVFAFASPQILKELPSVYPKQLNYEDEFRHISNALKQNKVDMKYMQLWATKDNLQSINISLPTILHFSGHGEIEKGDVEATSDYLLIEDENMKGIQLKKKGIQELMLKNVRV